jgi:hypothetical protein
MSDSISKREQQLLQEREKLLADSKKDEMAQPSDSISKREQQLLQEKEKLLAGSRKNNEEQPRKPKEIAENSLARQVGNTVVSGLQGVTGILDLPVHGYNLKKAVLNKLTGLNVPRTPTMSELLEHLKTPSTSGMESLAQGAAYGAGMLASGLPRLVSAGVAKAAQYGPKFVDKLAKILKEGSIVNAKNLGAAAVSGGAEKLVEDTTDSKLLGLLAGMTAYPVGASLYRLTKPGSRQKFINKYVGEDSALLNAGDGEGTALSAGIPEDVRTLFTTPKAGKKINRLEVNPGSQPIAQNYSKQQMKIADEALEDVAEGVPETLGRNVTKNAIKKKEENSQVIEALKKEMDKEVSGNAPQYVMPQTTMGQIRTLSQDLKNSYKGEDLYNSTAVGKVERQLLQGARKSGDVTLSEKQANKWITQLDNTLKKTTLTPEESLRVSGIKQLLKNALKKGDASEILEILPGMLSKEIETAGGKTLQWGQTASGKIANNLLKEVSKSQKDVVDPGYARGLLENIRDRIGRGGLSDNEHRKLSLIADSISQDLGKYYASVSPKAKKAWDRFNETYTKYVTGDGTHIERFRGEKFPQNNVNEMFNTKPEDWNSTLEFMARVLPKGEAAQLMRHFTSKTGKGDVQTLISKFSDLSSENKNLVIKYSSPKMAQILTYFKKNPKEAYNLFGNAQKTLNRPLKEEPFTLGRLFPMAKQTAGRLIGNAVATKQANKFYNPDFHQELRSHIQNTSPLYNFFASAPSVPTNTNQLYKQMLGNMIAQNSARAFASPPIQPPQQPSSSPANPFVPPQ